MGGAGGERMTVHYSVTVDFDASDDYDKAQLYDMFRHFVEQDIANGVMFACNVWKEDDE